MNDIIIVKTNALFGNDYFDEFISDEQYEALQKQAEELIKEYGWDAVFECWDGYMREYCHTIQEAISFANWFVAYGGQEHKIADPYGFLAYLYDIFDLCPVRYDAQIMDDVSYGLLEACGIKKHLWSDDSYTTETDPEMIKAVEKLRESRKSSD